MVHVLFADTVDESDIAPLHASGLTITVKPDLSGPDLETALSGVDILVVRSTKVTAAALDVGNADQLQLIVRAGAGTDTIDVDAAAERGIPVANVPGRNAVAVAELAMGLLLAVDRRIADNTADLRNGLWRKSEYSKADGVMGKTIGIIGCGAIGLAVAERAAAFGMRVLAQVRPNRDDATIAAIARIGIEPVDTQAELLRRSDVVSLHVPGGSETDLMVNRSFLSQMRPSAILINTSRGSTIDGAALLDALNTTDLRAGLDVFPDEPADASGPFVSAIAAHPQVVGTHHIGASTTQAQQAVADGTVEVIQSFLAGTTLNCVNAKQLAALRPESS